MGHARRYCHEQRCSNDPLCLLWYADADHSDEQPPGERRDGNEA